MLKVKADILADLSVSNQVSECFNQEFLNSVTEIFENNGSGFNVIQTMRNNSQCMENFTFRRIVITNTTFMLITMYNCTIEHSEEFYNAIGRAISMMMYIMVYDRFVRLNGATPSEELSNEFKRLTASVRESIKEFQSEPIIGESEVLGDLEYRLQRIINFYTEFMDAHEPVKD